MQMNTIALTYPDGPGTKPVCASSDVISAYGLGVNGNGYMRGTVRERREGLVGRRAARTRADPLHLYKYRALDVKEPTTVDRARAMLVHDRVWVSDSASLNDLSDMQFRIEENKDPKTRKQWAKDNEHLLPWLPPAKRLLRRRRIERAGLTPEVERGIRQDIAVNMGVFCASTDPRSRQMWAHYAAEHKGICVQLATYEDELFVAALPVVYADEFPTLRVPTPLGGNQEFYLRKHTDWAYEKEWRAVLPLNGCSITMRPRTISAVILGARANADTVAAVNALQQERMQLGKPAFRLYRASQAPGSHDIRISRA